MIFHRIDYTDTHGFLSNMWRLDKNSAGTVASRLTELGMRDVRVEPVDVPMGDAKKLKQWLNENPNSPNMKEKTMDMPGHMPDPERVNHYPEPNNVKLEWPKVPKSVEAFRVYNERGERKYELEAVLRREPPSALATQVDGDHYKKLGAYQPWEVLKHWLTPEEFHGYMKGTAIAYLAREMDKGGNTDIEKGMHTLQGLLEMEQRETVKG